MAIEAASIETSETTANLPNLFVFDSPPDYLRACEPNKTLWSIVLFIFWDKEFCVYIIIVTVLKIFLQNFR